MKSGAREEENMLLRHFWHTISDPFVKFVIIWNKWRHSFRAQCAHWHGNECFPPIIHQFNAECDPACEYLTAVHASLICIPLSHYLHLSVFLLLSVAFFPPSIVRFQEFPLGAVQVLRPKQKGVLSVSLLSYFLCPFTSWSPHSLPDDDKIYSSEMNLNWTHRISFIPHKKNGRPWPKCAPEGCIFDLPLADHDLWPPCRSWDPVLPSSPPGATGNGLLWPSGLCSHGEAHYCSHLAG